MTVEGTGAARETPTMTALPQVEDLPVAERGLDEGAVREAFEAFRRHAGQLQAQLRVLQAAGRSAQGDPTGQAVRMDALRLIREAAEFADVLERDAQIAAAAQIQRTEQEVRQKQVESQRREAEVQRHRDESERQRNEILTAARNEARQLVADANRDAAKELREAETRGARLLEQARHQATELANATRAEVEQTLEWARAQASAIIARAQQGTEQLLGAAGLGEAAASEVAEAIVKAAESSAQASRAAEPETGGSGNGDVAGASPPLRRVPADGTPGSPQAAGPTPPAPPPGQSEEPPSGSGDTNV
jgi:F0F1-type ATP synthase membrane subunit b/b'